ncbi:GyrI-like domain-containing protein [Microbacterium deminutum]|uniref:AraC effector-binding domain-containing protein n=1 Tax=Microbacterium deminutum TaxID=344164 RepID=A0ABN2QV44_9MICO
MAAEVTLRTVEPTPTAVVAAVTTWEEFPSAWRPMLDEVWHFLRNEAPSGLYRNGHNIMLYKDAVPSVEIGVQVVGGFDSHGRVVASSLPGGLVATATHTGPMAELDLTYRALDEWISQSAYRRVGPHWEIYGDPDRSTGQVDVEVCWLLAAA